MNILVSMHFGSQLYGTATPESDTDIKGVFLPEHREMMLARASKHRSFSTGTNASKNSAEDRDEEFYSLHYFVELACLGETVALDMLHAPEEMLIVSSPTWLALRSHRARFYTKSLKAFVGYARRQAAKYGVKGSRLASAKAVLALMEEAEEKAASAPSPARMAVLGESLAAAALEHVYLEETWAQVCGKKLLWAARISEYLPTMRHFVTEYGVRARLAAWNEGIDWKAISHAFRAAYEVRHILLRGDFTFPLAEAPFLREVKAGKIPFAEASLQLEVLMEELERLSIASTLPSSVDRQWWDEWLLATLDREYSKGPIWDECPEREKLERERRRLEFLIRVKEASLARVKPEGA
jgi:RNA repair pathway DNA polymerase beta family protein